MIRIVIALIATLIVGGIKIFLPIVTNGSPPPFPVQIELHAPGYQFVGGAQLFIACAPDSTLRISAYAKRPDFTEGHTVFAVDIAKALLEERPEYRPANVIRGTIAGARPLSECGVSGILSAIISDEKGGRIEVRQGW